jgi:hypothetical protein
LVQVMPRTPAIACTLHRPPTLQSNSFSLFVHRRGRRGRGDRRKGIIIWSQAKLQARFYLIKSFVEVSRSRGRPSRMGFIRAPWEQKDGQSKRFFQYCPSGLCLTPNRKGVAGSMPSGFWFSIRDPLFHFPGPGRK